MRKYHLDCILNRVGVFTALTLSLAFICPHASLQARGAASWLFAPDEKNVLLVEPRILAHVNGKVITVVDLMNKMDLVFYEKYADYADSLSFRYQFYQMSWRNVLQDLIDQELMLADAGELKIELSRGEIRKEMEKRFGPNVVANVQKARLQYDEAVALVRADMLIQRLLYFKVHTPAMRYTTPKEVQIAYEEYQKNNQLPAEMTYRVISVRSQMPERANEVASLIYQRLIAGDSIDDVVFQMQAEENVKVSAGEEEKRAEGDLSEGYRTVLTRLQAQAYSEPVAQESRKRGETLLRIFHLKELRPAGALPLAMVEEQLKDQLLNEASERLTGEYLKGLRTRYRVEEIQDYKKIPEAFEPFQMK